MSGSRVIPMILAAVILFLRGGDCVPLVLADKATRDCCTRGKCGPKESNPCCKASSPASINQVQPEAKFSIPPLEFLSFAVAEESPDQHLMVASAILVPLNVPLHSPPGLSAETPLPLLV